MVLIAEGLDNFKTQRPITLIYKGRTMSVHPNKRAIHEKAHELNEKRKECNREILRRLTEYLENNPGQRFGQALSNLNIVESVAKFQGEYWHDEYYVEPEDVLKRLK